MTDSIPLPREIEDLDQYLADGTFAIRQLSDDEISRYRPVVTDLVKSVDSSWDEHRLNQELNRLQRKYRTRPSKCHMLDIYRESVKSGLLPQNRSFERIIRKKANRSTSGVVVITVLLGPGQFSCPMNCHYCPNDPAIARSYLLNEPAVRRGFMNGWDACNQFNDRADSLYRAGHQITKIEIIIEGGTFGSYPHDYIDTYFRDLYFSANTYGQASRPKLSLAEEINLNQTSNCAIIGITIETRPDWINRREILRFRRLGVTRVQLGIQHLDDQILDLVNRQCPTYRTIQAIQMLKENGFKVDGHFMPDLPGSSYQQDLEMFKYLFSPENEGIQCDQMKIYPVMTTDYTEILRWYQHGRYKPYAEEQEGKQMTDLLLYICTNVPYWVRLNRIVRDIPHQYIHGGLRRVNLRQDIDEILSQRGLKARDIRGREPKSMIPDLTDCQIWIDRYRSSGGDEYFISYENSKRTIIYGFVRLRLSRGLDHLRYFQTLHNCALIRELHVYGEMVHQDDPNTGTQTQHRGLGKGLMAKAESLAKFHGYQRIAVISGIGVRRYYQKLGYHLEDTYMVKSLSRRSYGAILFIIIIVCLVIKFSSYFLK